MKSTEAEFLKIITRYQGIIHKINLIYFRTSDDKKDNFQEIVYHLWKSFPSLKDESKISSWIYSVAINVSISKIRKDSRYVFTDSLPEMMHTDDTDLTEQDMNLRKLLDVIRHFNETDKSIILLYLEELSYKEIAGIIGISVSNVGVKIHRLIGKLQEHFNDK
jgi:RNA polymerase sigma-70 factor (ECF subfamily)